MSRSSLETKLTDQHYEQFLHRAACWQINDVHAWIEGLGYNISRTAVGRKMKTLRELISPEAIAHKRALGRSDRV